MIKCYKIVIILHFDSRDKEIASKCINFIFLKHLEATEDENMLVYSLPPWLICLGNVSLW